MSPVWVNGKILDTTQPKAKDWSPPPEPTKELWATCPDCGWVIYRLESCWTMADKTVCVWGGCWRKYHELGLGYHAPAGLDLGLALEA